jgi:hypothetical protein
LKRSKAGTDVQIEEKPYYRSNSGSFKSVTKKEKKLNTEVIEAGNC